MKRSVIIILLISSLFNPVLSEEAPYVLTPSIPYTAFSAIALYESGRYGEALGACQWLSLLQKEDGSFGETSFSKSMPKFTAFSLMALIRCENLARGLYRGNIESAAYWLLYIQNDDGSFGDVVDTAAAVVALTEYRGELKVGEAIKRGLSWLRGNEGSDDFEELFRLWALGDVEGIKKLDVGGEDGAFKYFALAYLGEAVEVSGDYKTPLGNALALYASRSDFYLRRLLERGTFGFWGFKRYNTAELIDVSRVSGFEDLKPIACSYIDLINPSGDVEKAVFANYLLECGIRPDLSVNESALLPWLVAEVARLKAILGEDYSGEVALLWESDWGDFYNTAYVAWVLHSLNVTVPDSELSKLKEGLKEGYPTYYYASALKTFHDFGMEEEEKRTLSILQSYQNPDGGFGYNANSPSGLRSTALVLQALEYAGVENEICEKGRDFLRSALYADIPEAELDGDLLRLQNATFLLIRDSRFAGRAENATSIENLDGVLVVYPSENPLMVKTIPVEGFSPAKGALNVEKVALPALLALALILLVVGKRR